MNEDQPLYLLIVVHISIGYSKLDEVKFLNVKPNEKKSYLQILI